MVGDVLSEPTLTMLTQHARRDQRVATLLKPSRRWKPALSGDGDLLTGKPPVSRPRCPANDSAPHSDTVAWAALTDRTAARRLRATPSRWASGSWSPAPLAAKASSRDSSISHRRSHVTDPAPTSPVSADPSPAKPSKESDAAPAVLEKTDLPWLRADVRRKRREESSNASFRFRGFRGPGDPYPLWVVAHGSLSWAVLQRLWPLGERL